MQPYCCERGLYAFNNLPYTIAMKKSVNGKSFDEIFSQGGSKVNLSAIKPGIYSDDDGIFEYLGKPELCHIYCNELDNNGRFRFKNRPSIVVFIKDSVFYEATPDQIELLNAYRNSPEV